MMIRPLTTRRHSKRQSGLTLFLAGLIGFLVLAGSLFQFRKPIVQNGANTDETTRGTLLKDRLLYSSDTLHVADAPTKTRFSEAYGKLPLSFEVNQGQVNGEVRFLARGSGYNFFLTPSEAVLAVRPSSKTEPPSSADLVETNIKPPQQQVLRMKLVGANPSPEITGVDEQPGKSNYFIGNDPSQWRTNVPHFARVHYRNVYPGVSVSYYGNQRQLEYDFVVAPGANGNAIKLAFTGAQHLSVGADGDLILMTASGGELRQHKPEIYQEVEGERIEVAGRYAINEQQEVGFEIAEYDHARPLVIDPVLAYSTYFGGSGEDVGQAIAVDASGNAYVTGYTTSVNFPTVNPLPYGPDGEYVFISKLNAAGSALVYSTYLGGNGGNQRGLGIAVDAVGNAYVTGVTNSSSFPTVSALQGNFGGRTDAFVSKLSQSGSALIYSTCLGGSDYEFGRGIALDSAGNAYVTGQTDSTNFPTANALQPAFGGYHFGGDAFVSKLNASGSAFVYSTYVGGNDYDDGGGIAADSSGNAYLTGTTHSSNFPTVNAFQSTIGSICEGQIARCFDAFAAKLNPSGSAFIYSTYLGGAAGDGGSSIAVDASGSAYLTGSTGSSNFPTLNPIQLYSGGSAFIQQADAFVTKFNASGALVYSTYLGGGVSDGGNGIAVDASGCAYVIGTTDSSSFPVVNNFQPAYGGNQDAFLTKINPAGSAFLYSSFLGGSNYERGFGVAVDSTGNAFVTGDTRSSDFPTATPFQSVYGNNPGSGNDAFVTRIGDAPQPPATLSISAVTPNRGGNTGTVSVTIHGSGFVNGAAFKLRRAGQSDVAATAVGISSDGTVARTRFDLTEQLSGVWDLVVDSNGLTVIRTGGFIIEESGVPHAWVDIIGRDAFRPGRTQTFNIVYGNRGSVDAIGVPIAIAFPREVTWRLGFPITRPAPPSWMSAAEWNDVPIAIERDGKTYIVLIIGRIAAGESRMLPIQFTVPDIPMDNISLMAWIPKYPPSFPLIAAPPTQASANDVSRISSLSVSHSTCRNSDRSSAQFPPGGDGASEDCQASFMKTIFTGIDALPVGCVPGAIKSFYTSIGNAAIDGAVETPVYHTFIDAGLSLGGSVAHCAGKETLGAAFSAFSVGFSLGNMITGCTPLDEWLIKQISIIRGFDPNSKIGASGVGMAQFISSEETLRYAIFYENKPDATAPAQDVIITDQLEASQLDFDTFSFGPVSFGSDQVVVPPPGWAEFTNDVDLRPRTNVIVRIAGKLNKTTGLLTWRFTSLDPATGQPTEDPTTGFLPPNHTAPEGEGQVLFTVQPKQGIATGTEIRNKARIVFDTNAPIDTPEWFNTIDNSKPVSHVLPLPATQSSIVFNVAWTGTDTGSGVKSYTVYSAANGEAFTPWLVDTTATSSWFVGQPATTYSFYTIARDATGNLESTKTAAEATTTTTSAIVNSIDDQRFFVYQHYADFLNRVPDEAGLDFWTRQITDCGSDQTCVELKRINVSAAFFLSIEFQETGYLVYRTYKTAYGNLAGAPVPLTFNEFLPDTQQIGQGVVVGQTGWEQALENNKQAFAMNFVARSRFINAYSTTLTPAAFVDALYANAGVVPLVAERTAAINEFGGASNTADTAARARVLRRVAENSVLKQQELNKAFVLTQYFGYLRRNPNDPPEPMLDFAGYNFWLTKLDQFNGNFVNADMVKAFIVSAEYRQRFGP